MSAQRSSHSFRLRSLRAWQWYEVGIKIAVQSCNYLYICILREKVIKPGTWQRVAQTLVVRKEDSRKDISDPHSRCHQQAPEGVFYKKPYACAKSTPQLAKNQCDISK